MSECKDCFYYAGTKSKNTIVCDRIWTCYVDPNKECNYFKLDKEGSE